MRKEAAADYLETKIAFFQNLIFPEIRCTETCVAICGVFSQIGTVCWWLHFMQKHSLWVPFLASLSLPHTHTLAQRDRLETPSAAKRMDACWLHTLALLFFSAGLVTENRKNQKTFSFLQKTHQIASNHAAVSPHCTGISENPRITTLTKLGTVCCVYLQFQTDHKRNSDTAHFCHVTRLNYGFQWVDLGEGWIVWFMFRFTFVGFPFRFTFVWFTWRITLFWFTFRFTLFYLIQI